MFFWDLPELNSWDNYYKCPDGKVRLGLKLTKPSLYLPRHEFYYLSDEFSVIFEPLDGETTYMLVEGPHENPLGERIPILSTWQHLRVWKADVNKSGIQYAYAFYNNNWWQTEFSYKELQVDTNIDCNAFKNTTWCTCNKSSFYMDVSLYGKDAGNGHIFSYASDHYTIFKDKSKGELYSFLKNETPIGIIADYLEEKSDMFGHYLRNINYNKPIGFEIEHMRIFLKEIENERAAKLLLLTEGMKCGKIVFGT